MQEHTVSSEQRNTVPILIIDKTGTIGMALTEKLKSHALIVVVSGQELAVDNKVVHLPYQRKIPLIPDNRYSYMFIVFNGEEEMLEMLPAFVKKANDTGSQLFFIVSIELCTEQLIHRFSHHLYHNMHILVYGQLFANETVEENEPTFIINQVRQSKRITLSNDGLDILYPVFLTDLLHAIIEIASTKEKKSKITLIFSKSGITQLSFAHVLQKLNPLVKIDFKKQKRSPADYYIPLEGRSFFPSYDVESRLKKIDFSQEIQASASSKKKHFIPRKKNNRNIRPWIFLTLVAIVFVPVMTIFVCIISGAWTMQASLREVEKGKFASAKNYASIAENSFSSAQMITESFFLLNIVGPHQKEQLLRKVRTGKEAAATEIDMLNAAILFEKIQAGESKNPKKDFLHVLATIKNSLLILQKMKAEGNLPKSISEKLDEMGYALSLFENTIDIYPTVLGFEGEKKYLVLFQNNMELRPGGGFIGSFGLLELKNGKTNNFKIFDVYDADGKLSIHKEPPYSLRRYLGASHWFLRDSNMSVDFTKNAQEATQFLELEIGEKVDGVIAIDTDFLKNMLSVLGSVTVPDYNETVRPENFYLLTQAQAENDFFPGSTQKKDFLRALSNAMLFEMFEKKNIQVQPLIKKIGESIKEKHLLFASSDPSVQKVLTVNKISASLWDDRRQEDNSFLDSFGVIDANVGANKSNYYLNRSLKQHVAINETGDLHTTATVTYENTSSENSPFGGDYKNYVRFLLPANASLVSVTVDNQVLSRTPAITDPAVYTASSFIPPSGLEIEEKFEEKKKLIGFFPIVPESSTKKVAITYTVNNAVNMEEPSFSYQLRVYKQPGTRRDSYSLSIAYPDTVRVLESIQGSSDVGGKLLYERALNEDFDISAKFVKK